MFPSDIPKDKIDEAKKRAQRIMQELCDGMVMEDHRAIVKQFGHDKEAFRILFRHLYAYGMVLYDAAGGLNQKMAEECAQPLKDTMQTFCLLRAIAEIKEESNEGKTVREPGGNHQNN